MIAYIELFPREEPRAANRTARRARPQESFASATVPATLQVVFAAADPLPTEDWHLPHSELIDYYV
jgi:hypothetical protein